VNFLGLPERRFSGRDVIGAKLHATAGVKRHIAGFGLECHQTDGDAEVFRFPG